MKKLLLASTALVLSAGVAAAEVKVGGDARMGIIDDFGPGDISFTSRIRISFAASGQTDGGLTFGGSIRADNSGTGSGALPQGQTGGNVFISGAFGRLTMGDVSGAAEAAVGDVSGVGLTGLGDLNDASYLSNSGGGVRSAMRYDYSFGAFGFHISADNPTGTNNIGTSATVAPAPVTAGAPVNIQDTYSVAVTYSEGAIRAGLGYETTSLVGGGSIDHIVLGGQIAFGDATIKANYGTADVSGGPSLDQYGVSVDYKFDALTVTAFYTSNEIAGFLGRTDPAASFSAREAYGIGAAYSLGGGATLRGGYARNDSASEDAFDFGIALTF